MPQTFGRAGAPAQVTYNYDALFSQTLSKTKKKLIEQVGTTNACFYEIVKKKNMMEAEVINGGTHLEGIVMHDFGAVNTYDRFEALPSQPTEGVTKYQHEIRKIVKEVMWAGDDERKNKGEAQVINFVKTKIKQATMAMEEGWSDHFFNGNGNGALATPWTSPTNGTFSLDPLAKIISKDPAVGTYGNLSRADNVWWRNKAFDGTGINTGTKLFEAMQTAYTRVGLGTGGECDLILMDPAMNDLYVMSWFAKYNQQKEQIPNYPFQATQYKNAKVVVEEKLPDANGNFVSGSAATGTIYFINTKFMQIHYDPDLNFSMLENESGKAFVKPPNQDARIGHMVWRGQIVCNKLSKQGVIYGVPRTFTTYA